MGGHATEYIILNRKVYSHQVGWFVLGFWGVVGYGISKLLEKTPQQRLDKLKPDEREFVEKFINKS